MNPINYALGLAHEVSHHAQGDKQREASARESLTWAAAELEKLDPAKLSASVRALFEEAKQAAADALTSKPKRAAKAPAATE
jgi:hypothetical protein